MNVNIVKRTIVCAANAQTTVDLSGTYLLLISSTGNFNFSIDGGPFLTGVTILGIDLRQDASNQGQSFKQLVFVDTSGAQNSITFMVAYCPVTYFQALQTNFVKNANTYLKGTGVQALADGAAYTQFTGTDSGGQIRKQFIVSNLGSTLIYVQDGNSNNGVAVPAGTSATFETSGALYVKNIAGSGAGSFCAMEVFYS